MQVPTVLTTPSIIRFGLNGSSQGNSRMTAGSGLVKPMNMKKEVKRKTFDVDMDMDNEEMGTDDGTPSYPYHG